MFNITSEYPSDAAGGCDFVANAAVRDIADVGPGEDLVMRPERVVVFDRVIDADEVFLVGRVCIGEATVRMVASELDMVDKVHMRSADRAKRAAEREVVELRARNEQLEQALAALRMIDSRQEAPA